MSSIGHSASRPLRDYGRGQILANFPGHLVREFGLEAGAELAFDDGHIYLDPENAPCYAPTRRLRRQSGEFVVNIPETVVDERELDDNHAIDYRKPADRRIPYAFQEARDD